ncbi:hypothetical protein C8R45DRAFT_1098861 [Mycena sanguinolenta]|nr:hypothetical protein C8R45DRAFT_1098861 [Mycena sanguinolenta]
MSIQSKLCWHMAAHHDPVQLPPRQLLHFVGPRRCTDGESCEREWTPPVNTPTKKIKLFDHDSEGTAPPKQASNIKQSLPSTIIGDLLGRYTAAERQARVGVVLAQRAAVEAAAGWARMLRHITLMAELVKGVQSRKEAREERLRQARLKAESERKDRESMLLSKQHPNPRGTNGNALASSDWYMTGSGPMCKIRIIYPEGRRAARDKPLSEDELYLTDARPAFLARPRLDHTCGLCLNAKSYPVKLCCGHSACYVCVRMELENNWECNRCGQKIMRPPKPDDVEAAEINKEYPGWDTSVVEYRWDGLQWPRARRGYNA